MQVEHWFRATRDGSFAYLLSRMDEEGSSDFHNVDVNDYVLDDLRFSPSGEKRHRPIRCWKLASKIYIVVRVRDTRYGYYMGREHIINLIDRLKSIANVRLFSKVYRVSGLNGAELVDISKAVAIVEEFMGHDIRNKYPAEADNLCKAMKQTLAILENLYHENAIPADLGNYNPEVVVNLFKNLGLYEGLILDLCNKQVRRVLQDLLGYGAQGATGP